MYQHWKVWERDLWTQTNKQINFYNVSTLESVTLWPTMETKVWFKSIQLSTLQRSLLFSKLLLSISSACPLHHSPPSKTAVCIMGNRWKILFIWESDTHHPIKKKRLFNFPFVDFGFVCRLQYPHQQWHNG